MRLISHYQAPLLHVTNDFDNQIPTQQFFFMIPLDLFQFCQIFLNLTIIGNNLQFFVFKFFFAHLSFSFRLFNSSFARLRNKYLTDFSLILFANTWAAFGISIFRKILRRILQFVHTGVFLVLRGEICAWAPVDVT